MNEQGSAGAPRKPAPPAVLRLPPRAPRSKQGCQRWAGTGCIAGLVLMVAAIIASVLLMQNGVGWAVERARNRLDSRLATDVSDRVGEPVRERLDAFVRSLDAREDPIPVMGEFLRRTGEALEDDRLTEPEVEALDDFMRDTIASSGGVEAVRP